MSSKREVDLIGSTIRNGRIYFSSTDIKFFPADSLADRETDGHKGKDVTFIFAGYSILTDIRISSGQRISPRKSFGKPLADIGALEGGKLVVERTSEREYHVSYVKP